MLHTESRLFRTTTKLVVVAMVNLSMPLGFASTINDAIKSLDRPGVVVEAPKPSRLLTAHEMKAKSGRQSGQLTGMNPYVSGSRKWAVNYKGIDMTTGNYSVNATDLSFDTGYGIPVNVTRSYSSNGPDEGPLGYGWTLSVDVRSTAGGILKSSGAPVMSVPNNFKERPSAQLNDPNAPMGVQPVAAVVATDASGNEETIQKDVDGILTTPPWDKNTITSTYEYDTLNGSIYQVLSGTTTTTPDGTVYVYGKHGFYVNGTQPYGGGAGGEYSNVLKVNTATDRQGNVTTYTYTSGAGNQQLFWKYNGQTQEDLLQGIYMATLTPYPAPTPNHYITFTWGNGSNAPRNRIVSAQDNGGRIVGYSYYTSPPYCLNTVTSAGGYTTTYGYGTALADTNYVANGLPVDPCLLTTITDPRNLTTTIQYAMNRYVLMQGLYGGALSPTPVVFWLQEPSSVTTEMISVNNGGVTSGSLGSLWIAQYPVQYQVCSGGFTGPVMFNAEMIGYITSNTSPATVTIDMSDSMGCAHLQYSPKWSKVYEYWTEDLLQEIDYTYPYVYNDLHLARQMSQTNMSLESVETDNTYNFMGNPLSKSVLETVMPVTGSPATRGPNVTSYAYWDSTKFYQQKAVVDPANRISFTDYFTNTAAQGSIGQKLYVYDPKDTTYTGYPGSGWQGVIAPVNPATYSGTFQYDTQGRCTDVWKLQSTTSNPWTYVQTHTFYGGDGTPTWGQAYQVIEDYGTGHINRTTYNNAYTAWGKPCSVTDAAGHVFNTMYFDNDGNVSSVSTPTQTLVSYSYVRGGITNGVPTAVTDGLTGVTQSIKYQAVGNGIGKVAEIDQIGGANPLYNVGGNGIGGYSTIYTYSAAGDRTNATYYTANGVISWQYGDYLEVGSADNPNRTFQTLTKLSAGSGSSLTAEEMDYQYDSSGRLTGSAFAQTPYTGFTPSGSNPWYDVNHPAQSRARAYYAYDAGGRTLACEHYWDTLTTGTTTYGTPTAIILNDCAYDAVLGLKSTSIITDNTAVQPPLSETDSYTYDPQLDYLASATYGNPPAQNWTYDAAGNRTDSVCDNLNRTTINGTTNCDILGNRLALGSTSYSWDCLNRMIGLTNSGTTSTYEYRADGMRSHKVVSTVKTEYYHDGQMPMEDAVINGTTLTATRYGLGARGIDYEEEGVGTWTNNTTRSPGAFSNVGFPIYDAHGNMIATLARAGGNTCTIANKRGYDAWGAIRIGAVSGDPKNRYCASLGHQNDDESGLIYMRKRYYEPSSGRFVSEDPKRNSYNWFTYASCNPVNLSDNDGQAAMDPMTQAAIIGLIFGFMMAIGGTAAGDIFSGTIPNLMQLLQAIGAGIVGLAGNWLLAWVGKNILGTAEGLASRIPQRIGYLKGFAAVGMTGIALGAIVALAIYDGQLLFELYEIDHS
jgi:RHS repeat-associated protein